MANLVGNKVLYISGLALFGVSMFFTVIFPSVVVLNVCAAFSGLGFAVATTIPCTLITKYHEQPEIFFRDTRTTVQSSTSSSTEMTTTTSLQNGVGGDMAVLGKKKNFFMPPTKMGLYFNCIFIFSFRFNVLLVTDNFILVHGKTCGSYRITTLLYCDCFVLWFFISSDGNARGIHSGWL